MSLTDSLLLDPVAPPRVDLWFAVRTDGVQGSGTESDPYNVSPQQEAAISITGIAWSTGSREAVVTTAAPHGYNNSDVVLITGVTGSGAAQFNGRFSIYSASGSTFTYAMAAVPGGSASGTITCARVSFPIDSLLYLNAPQYTTVHLGPGVIETRGFSQRWGGRFARSGQKIIGSGIEVTTLKIVHGAFAEVATVGDPIQYNAIGTYIDSNITDFEASDFTVDCNLGGQPVVKDNSYFSPVLCGAIIVVGSRIRICRVRAINWGGQNSTTENFVLFTGLSSDVIGGMTDCVIEDCILEKPALSNNQLVTCMGIGGFVDRNGYHGAFHRGCVIRNNVVDCRYQANPVPISSITYSGTTATVTTTVPHNRAAGTWVRIAGAFVNGVAINPFNGSFQVLPNPTSTTFQYTMQSTPAAPPVGEIWVDRFPSHEVGITGISVIIANSVYEITTYSPHYRIPGDPVSIHSVQVASGYSAVFNGLFQVSAVSTPTTFRYQLLTNPDGTPNVSGAAVGWEYHAIGADTGTAAVEEGNRVFGARYGHYGDTGSTKDIIIRNNYYYDVVCGVYYNMGSIGPATSIALGQGITYDSGTLIATFTTPVAHGLLPKSAVQITGAKVNGNDPPANTYNGYYEVLDTPTTTTFRYQMGANPGANADTNTGQYREYWRVRHLVVENNVVELTAYLGAGASFGILLANYPQQSPLSIYLQSIIRGNVIREVNDAADPNSVGVYLWQCENAVTEQNVVDPAVGSAIFQTSSGVLEYFGNTTPAGVLLQGYDQQQSRKVDELTTRIEDSLVVSF